MNYLETLYATGKSLWAEGWDSDPPTPSYFAPSAPTPPGPDHEFMRDPFFWAVLFFTGCGAYFLLTVLGWVVRVCKGAVVGLSALSLVVGLVMLLLADDDRKMHQFTELLETAVVLAQDMFAKFLYLINKQP